MSTVQPIEWSDGVLRLLDQRVLPLREEHVACHDAPDVARAIADMVVRGAPAIGVTAAFGVALAARREASRARDGGDLAERIAADARQLKAARPTAVNLAWAVDRCLEVLADARDASARDAARAVEERAVALLEGDVRANRALGRHGAALIADGATVLTHCNAGALATAGYGTALGVVRAACEAGKRVAVVADETRPFLQGSRLTAWELARDGIPVTVVADVAAASLLRDGTVDAVVVGADRIAANGDVANKVGTYPLAVLARRHDVPFHVAAPCSTVDLSVPDGAAIPIEERAAEEVLTCQGRPVAPPGVGARNPAFDVTPADLVTSIVTEVGVVVPPYGPGLAEAVRRSEEPR